jgi:HEAT repeat protein
MYKYIALVLLLVAGSGFVTELLKRQQRERGLENLSPEAQAEFDGLARLIRDPAPEKRAGAVDGLRALGSLEAAPLLIDALADPNKQVALKSLAALEYFDYRIGAKGCERLLRLARGPDSEVRADAERAAKKLCDWRAAPLIIAEAERPDSQNRQFLFALLEHCASHVVAPDNAQKPDDAALLQSWKDWFAKYKDKAPADWLIDDLKSPSPEGRAMAADALGRLREQRAAAPLAALLKDEDETVCLRALNALAIMKARDALPAISQLYLASSGARATACESEMIHLADYAHIPALAADLAKADKIKIAAYVRLLEAASGHKMPQGADAPAFWSEYSSSVKGLTPLAIRAKEAKDPDRRNRFEAMKRLKESGPAAVELLLAGLEDQTPAVREEAAKSLKAVTFYYVEFKPEAPESDRNAAIGKWRDWWKSKKTVPPAQRLITQLQDRRDPRNRVEAAIALRQADAWEAVPRLIDALSDESEALRYYSASALKNITKQSFDFSSNAPPEERAKAVEQWRSWWKNGKTDKETALIETIRNITADKSSKIRAIQALTQMGSKKAVGALANLLDDKSFVLSSIAEEALEKLTGKSFFYFPEGSSSGRDSVSSAWREYLTIGKGV